MKPRNCFYEQFVLLLVFATSLVISHPYYDDMNCSFKIKSYSKRKEGHVGGYRHYLDYVLEVSGPMAAPVATDTISFKITETKIKYVSMKAPYVDGNYIALPYKTCTKLAFGMRSCGGSKTKKVPIPDSAWEGVFKLNNNFEYWGNPTSGGGAPEEGNWYYDNFSYDQSAIKMKYYFKDDALVPAFPFDETSGDNLQTYYPRPFAKFIYASKPEYEVNVYLFPGLGDSQYFNKPLVVGDAFDPHNGRGAFEIYDKKQFQRLLRVNDFQNSPRGNGYDVFFLDFSQGGGNILINAALQLAFAQWLEEQTTSEYIMGGPSMSGLIARSALLMGEQNQAINNCKGYISVDSPHQGASISARLQKVIGTFKFHCYARAANADPTDKWLQMNTPAAHQMLYEHTYSSETGVTGDCEHDGDRGFKTYHSAYENFYAYLERMGNYPSRIPKVAIAYSDFRKPHGNTVADKQDVGYIDPDYLGKRTLYAGGPPFTSAWHEFMPGSIGSWYYSTIKAKKGDDDMTLYKLGSGSHSETFKGTFIPIYSALDLRQNFFTRYNIYDMPSTVTEAELLSYSPFDKIMWMQQWDNSGGNYEYDGPDYRFEHMTFDQQLIDRINEGLAYIETNQDTTPSENISQGAAVQVSSAYSSSYDGSKMVDGLEGTKWNTGAGAPEPHWAIFDLGKTCDIHKYSIKHAGTREVTKYNTRDYFLQTSTDGINWVTVDDVTGNTASITEKTLTNAVGRYLRLYITSAGEYYARIYQFTAYGDCDLR